MSTDGLDQSIKRYRQSWGFTQEQFAERFGFVPRSVRRWESGAVEPRTKNRQKLTPCLKAREDAMDRRDFFRMALTVSMTFAAPNQQPDLQRVVELLSPAAGSLAPAEELSTLETLTKTCWQLLPHQANMVDRGHLTYVTAYRQKIESWLKSSPGSPIDVRLTETLSEIVQVEGGLLYALKRLDEAENAYRFAIRLAHEADNSLLEAIGLTWLGNFLIVRYLI